MQQPAPTARRDVRSTLSGVYPASGRQVPSVGYEHDATRRYVSRPGNGKMPPSDAIARSNSNSVNSSLTCPAHIHAPAVSMTQPSPPPADEHSSVVYTVQNTTTDTLAHETEYGGVLTIRTTTVTRTITERLVASDEDDNSSEDGEVCLKEEHDT
ncbi:hypothetical protein LSCM1_07479 [Leishmania martiniquensis]|uniref:Uncharacterized protein n=1 Tax=Leishmania martiniquensis TaxID=1580590 RepID=A0A836KVR2_9TRYP|nr:hypothetical protein LSCM1_07479 [Leishmania martiniquensis]